jgi:hypothetical protein
MELWLNTLPILHLPVCINIFGAFCKGGKEVWRRRSGAMIEVLRRKCDRGPFQEAKQLKLLMSNDVTPKTNY